MIWTSVDSPTYCTRALHSAAGEAVLELLHNHYMKLYEVRRPTNSGEQMSVPAKIFLSVAQRCTAEGIAELRQQGSDKKE